MAPAQDLFPEQASAQGVARTDQVRGTSRFAGAAIWFLAAPTVHAPAQAFGPLQVTMHELPAQVIEPAHDFGFGTCNVAASGLPQSSPPAQPFGPQVIGRA